MRARHVPHLRFPTIIIRGSWAFGRSVFNKGEDKIRDAPGVKHSEFNPSNTEPLHLFQIWIEPTTIGTSPGYEQIRFDPEEKKNKLKRLGGPTAAAGAARVNQDAQMFVAELAKGVDIPYSLGSERAAWLHVVRGAIAVNGNELRAGDAAAVTNEEKLTLTGVDSKPSEILLFDLA
jgi:redox-sensitive bicupin YhaK (pirin superfamily)